MAYSSRQISSRGVQFFNLRQSYLPGERVRVYYQVENEEAVTPGDCLIIRLYPQTDVILPACWPAGGKVLSPCTKFVDITIPRTADKTQRYQICYIQSGRRMLGCSAPFRVGEVIHVEQLFELGPAALRRYLEAYEKLDTRNYDKCVNGSRKFSNLSTNQELHRILSQHKKNNRQVQQSSNYTKPDAIRLLQALAGQITTTPNSVTKQMNKAEDKAKQLPPVATPIKPFQLASQSLTVQLAELKVSAEELRERLGDLDTSLILADYVDITNTNTMLSEQSKPTDRGWLLADHAAQVFRKRQLEDQCTIKSLLEEYRQLKELLSEEQLLIHFAKYAQQYLQVMEWHDEVVERKEKFINQLNKEMEVLKPLYYSKKSFVGKIEKLKKIAAQKEEWIKEYNTERELQGSVLQENFQSHLQGLEDKIYEKENEIVRLNELLFDQQNADLELKATDTKEQNKATKKKSSIDWDTLRWVLDDKNDWKTSPDTQTEQENQATSSSKPAPGNKEELFGDYWRPEFRFSSNLVKNKKKKARKI